MPTATINASADGDLVARVKCRTRGSRESTRGTPGASTPSGFVSRKPRSGSPRKPDDRERHERERRQLDGQQPEEQRVSG